MLIKNLAAAMTTICLAAACTSYPAAPDVPAAVMSVDQFARIQTVLDDQEAAWNSGDVDGYMQSYWQSPDLRFASGGTVVRGWQPTKDRYLARYSNRALMGTLSTTGLEINLIGNDDAVAHGGWALEREGDHPSGLFTLIMHQFDGEWLIISDTTTSAD